MTSLEPIQQIIESVWDRRRVVRNIDSITYRKCREFESQFSDYDIMWYWYDLIIGNPMDPDASIIDRLGAMPNEVIDKEMDVLIEYITRAKWVDWHKARMTNKSLNIRVRELASCVYNMTVTRNANQ